MYKVYILDKGIDIAMMPFGSQASFGAIVFDQARLNTTKMLKILQKSKSLDLISKQKAKEIDLDKHSLMWLVEAAGGVVSNEYGQLLMIFRNGCWDLPKGKLEQGELIEECALREVSEECGLELEQLERGDLITQSIHIYNIGDKNFIKRTWWYRMNYRGCKQLVPQLEEGITAAAWLCGQQLSEASEQTYGTIKEVLKEYKQSDL